MHPRRRSGPEHRYGLRVTKATINYAERPNGG